MLLVVFDFLLVYFYDDRKKNSDILVVRIGVIANNLRILCIFADIKTTLSTASMV